jgi:CBS domain-containing protein
MANDNRSKRGDETGTEAVRRSVDAGTEAMRRGGAAATEQVGRVTESAAQAASTYAEGARGAVEEMQALMRMPGAAIGSLHEISQTWSEVLGQAFQTNTRFSQDLLRCRTVQDVVAVQSRFVRESLAGLREGSAEMLRAASRLAEGAAGESEDEEDEAPGAVADVMSRNVRVVGPEDTVAEIARLMAKEDTGVLPVAEDDKLVGMITDRDLAVRVLAVGKDPAQTKAREVMTKEVKYCFEDEDLDHVAENMAEQRLRRLPVVNRAKRLVGIVSVGDLASEEVPHLAGQALGGIAQEGGPHRQRLPRGARAAAGSKPTKRGRGRAAKKKGGE